MQRPVVGVQVGTLLTGGGRFSPARSQSRSRASQPTCRGKRGHPSAGSQVWPNRCAPQLPEENTPSNGALSTSGVPLRPVSPEPTLITHPCPPLPWTLPMGSESQGHQDFRGASPRGQASSFAPAQGSNRSTPAPRERLDTRCLVRPPGWPAHLTVPPRCPLRAPPLSPDPLITVASRAGRPQISALIKMIAASVEGSAGCLRRKGPSCPLHLTAASACWDPASHAPSPPCAPSALPRCIQQGLNARRKMWLRAKG